MFKPRAAVFILAAWGWWSCSANFESGNTRCASKEPRCPSGFVCIDDRCHLPSAAPRGGQGGASGLGGSLGSQGGAGGAVGAGGDGGGTSEMPGSGGSGLTSGAMSGVKPNAVPDGGVGSAACDNPQYPVLCPAKNGVEEACWLKNVDCETVGHCQGSVVACTKGFVVDCNYPNFCSPKDNKCPDPAFPKFCPANGGAGPVCSVPEADCRTLGVCDGVVNLCAQGGKLDCSVGMCVPIVSDGGAPDGQSPQDAAGDGAAAADG